MSTCQDIIKSACRRGGLVGKGVILDAELANIGLERLIGIYRTMSNGLLGQVVDYYLTSGPYTATEQQRIYQADGTSVITIPVSLTDADTGITRAPLDGALIIVVRPGSVQVIWLYNTIIAAWQDIVTLGLTDVAPMSGEFDEQLKDMLAVLMCNEAGLPVPPETSRGAALGKVAIASRYQTRAKASCNEYF